MFQFANKRVLTTAGSYWLGAAVIWLGMQHLAFAQLRFSPATAPTGTVAGQRQTSRDSMADACTPYAGLTALVPQVGGIVWSQSAANKPTFFFQIPTALNNNVPLTFVVQDDNDNEVYRRRFRLRTAAGVLAVPVRGDGLTVDETYRWTFSVGCDDGASVAAVSGTVRRIAGPTVEPGNTPAVRMTRAEVYAAAGVWHEALEIAIAMAQAEPSNEVYQQNLTDLLSQAGLADAL